METRRGAGVGRCGICPPGPVNKSEFGLKEYISYILYLSSYLHSPSSYLIQGALFRCSRRGLCTGEAGDGGAVPGEA